MKSRVALRETARAFHNRTYELATMIKDRYFQISGRPVFKPPAVVINPKLAIDYWDGCCASISFTFWRMFERL